MSSFADRLRGETAGEQPRHFPYMDSMRAVAALSVLTYHTLHATDLPQPLSGWVRSGNLGVALFFFISGLLLYFPFARAHIYEQRPPWALSYGVRRVVRIVPVYWAALLVLAVFTSKAEPFPGGAWRYFLFGQTYSADTVARGISQAWTLDVEVLFYVLIPVFAFAVRSTRRRTPAGRMRVELIAIAALVAISWAFRLFVHGKFDVHDPASLPWRYSMPYQLDLFALGMALTVGVVWWQEHPRGDIGRFVDRAPWVSWAVALAALTVISLSWGGAVGADNWAIESSVHLLAIVVAAGALLPACVGDQTRGWERRRVLANPWLLYLGLISYSIYLWHGGLQTRLGPRVLDNLPDPIAPIAALLAVTLVSVAVAAVSYRVIERPAIALGRRMRRDRSEDVSLETHAAP
jgi:peptidoglycan/LPS O-acetylase OafA/YrhL